MCRPRVRWSAIRGALQFAGFLQKYAPRLEPARYEMTGVHNAFELMVHANVFVPLFILPVHRCSGPASGGVLRFATLEGIGSGCRPLPYVVHRVQDATAERFTSGIKSEALHRIENKAIPGGPRCWMGETPNKKDPRSQDALNTDTALPPFLVAVATRPEGSAPALETEQLVGGKIE